MKGTAGVLLGLFLQWVRTLVLSPLAGNLFPGSNFLCVCLVCRV